MTRTKQGRAGFTLLELLVVIAIIGILAAMTVTAVFRLKAASLETRTNETLEKLDRAYSQQYKAAIDAIRKEQIPQGLIVLANHDMDMAKAVHMKLRLRREFPQNLSDVNDAGVTGNATVNAQLYALYPPKAVYVALVPTLTPLNRAEQNTVLLMAALGLARGGASFDPEQVGSNALGKLPSNSAVKIFIDGYGNPMYYVRALSTPPTGDTSANAVLAELNQPPYVTAAAVSSNPKKADAIDPTGKLNQSWTGNAPMLQFIQNMRDYMNEPLDGTHRGPFVFSGGADKTPFTLDDLYSFRLTGTGKAN